MSSQSPESPDGAPVEAGHDVVAGESPFAAPSQPAAPYSWHPPKRRGGLAGKIVLLIVLATLLVLPFTGAGRRIKESAIGVIQAARAPVIVKEIIEHEKEKIVFRDPPPPPLPQKFIPQKQVNVAELFNGIEVQTEVQTEPGDLASRERKLPGSYVVKFSVDLHVPKANSSLDDLAGLNAALPKALPGLAVMMPKAKVSGFYHHLYELKQKAVQQNLIRLDKLLTRHNFFDCETVLELRHPDTGQRVLLVQGEMDVVADGSDGDRMSDFDDYIAKSDHFQPTTSYAWPKKTETPNPLVGRFESRIAEAKKKLNGAAAAQKKDIQGDIDYYRRLIKDLDSRSFLIAQEDPFIVIPVSMQRYVGFNEFAPQLGDYAVVAYGGKLLPAIVGDYGPPHITGEASLRLALEINTKATPYSRPESDLKVSYFIFPGSADKPFGPPDYHQWHQRCAELLARIGGVGEGHQLLEWEDRIKKRKQEEEAAKIALAKAAAEKAAAEKAKAAAAADKKPACGAGEDTAKTSDGPAAAKPAVQH
jgi:Fungal chitosanase of glycosyl hydrolase group 75